MPARRDGCFGEPSLVLPKQYTGKPRVERNCDMAAIFSRNTGFVPQATTILEALRQTRSTHSAFSGPTGSEAFNNPRQSVLIKENRFTTMMPPACSRLAKRRHISIVLSSLSASAVLGFSITNTKGARDSSHLRHRTYRYWRHGEKIASFGASHCSGQAEGILLPPFM